MKFTITNISVYTMFLLSLARRLPKVGSFSIAACSRHFSFSLNALQIHSFLVSGETKKHPIQQHHIKSTRKYVSSSSSSSLSRLYHSVSNDNTSKEEASSSKTATTTQSLSESHPYLAEIKPAISAIRKACRITTYLQPTTVDKNISGVNKKDSSPVTIGDFAVQALVLNLLEKEFCNDVFIAEEASKNLICEHDNETGEIIDLSQEILDVMVKCGFDKLIGNLGDLNRSIDIGQTFEEDGSVKKSILELKNICGSSFRTWCLDPIDGTRGFLRGKREGGQYCVALALIEDGNPVVGILGCPNLPVSSTDANYAWADDETSTNNVESRGCIIVASKGGGCYQFPLNPPDNEDDDSTSGCERIYVTQNDGQGTIPLSKARFCIGVEKYSDADGKMSSIAEAIHGELDAQGDIKYTARMDSQAKYGVLSRGGAEIYARLPKKSYVEWIWDHAPGRIVMEEAGGIQTDTNGNIINYGFGAKMDQNVDGVLASPGGVFHSALVRSLQQQ